ncbi:MAG: DUF5615 family PIN-like protein [Desulfotomaculales bacterium]
MRFPLDSPLSPWMAAELRRAGHDAVHARELGLAAAPDREVLARAAREGRVLLTADTDFGTLLASTGAHRPSVVVFRQTDKSPPYVLALFLANLPRLEEPLEKRAIVVFRDRRIRVRRLPLPPASRHVPP